MMSFLSGVLTLMSYRTMLRSLPVVANTSGSAGFHRTEITDSEPQEKELIGSDL